MFTSIEDAGDATRWSLLRDIHVGSGSFGIVVQGTFVGTPIAVKLANNSATHNSAKELANELRVLRYVRHPNIAMFHGSYFEITTQSIGIVLELVKGMETQPAGLRSATSLGRSRTCTPATQASCMAIRSPRAYWWRGRAMLNASSCWI